MILHLSDSFVVVNKPAGLPVLPDGWQPQAPYLLQSLQQTLGRLWVVHRLDKGSSGVMVFARNPQAHRALNLQFERRQTQKIYHALVTGCPAWETHLARHRLRVNVGHSHRTVIDHARGLDAETLLQVLRPGPAFSLVQAEPHTGRTHQIRVHLYALGHPLLGDSLYSAPPTDLIARPALHALRLTFFDPQSEQPFTFEAPYPADFLPLLERLP